MKKWISFLELYIPVKLSAMSRWMVVVSCFLASARLTAQNNSIFYGGNGGGSGVICMTLPVILPIELVFFEGTCSEGGVSLTWHTASEINSSSFIVERSNDGIEYLPVGELNAVGASSFGSDYTFTDFPHSTSTLYYRLRHLDMDGTSVVSGSLSVAPCVSGSLQIYPNPVSENCEIRFGRILSEGTLNVTDLLGQIVLVQDIENLSVLHLNTNELSAGTYVVNVFEQGSKSETFRIVKL